MIRHQWAKVVCLAVLGVQAEGRIFCSPPGAQENTPSWQEQIRECARKQDWSTALSLVDREIAGTPQDMDVRAWRARILMWSGRLGDAENEYREILAVSPNDADHWMGLASVYSREGQTEKAKQALDHALALDPKRADIHAARGRALRAERSLREAKLEFRRALELDPASEEARNGLLSLKGEPKHELHFGTNTDLFSFADPNHDQGASLSSQWTPVWRTTAMAGFYQRAGINAEKFSASLAGKLPRAGAFTVGGATAHDNGVIPRDEAFLEYDNGWKLTQNAWLRGLETVVAQHWYWYSTARILTINEMAIFYLPREWTWSFGLTEARSQFSGTEADWRPSGIARIGFPIPSNQEHRLGGNLFFAAGTENFAQVDQIGRFSSQTYGAGLRFQLTARQDLTGVAAYQNRTQDRNQTSFGLTYGLRF